MSEFTLTREVLSHHLATITSRNDEATFEHFARRLAEAEICPNLLPNTGPAGGGDAKADTETYPVSEEVALRWYQGEQAAAKERWAFAISAKKAWPSKAKNDVKSILESGRDYTTIYFITNQFARAKTRANLVKEVRNEYGIEIHILDLTWILDKVFDNNRVGLAVKALGLSTEYERQTKALGAKDFERTQELAKLDAQIADASRYDGTPHALAEDMLETVLLARGLGRSRQDIDGRFMAAQRAAQKAGNHLLQFKIVYNWAWTVYFWFDDFLALASLYGEAASLIAGNQDAAVVEKLGNLWSLLRMSASLGKVPPEIAKLEERGSALRGELAAIAANQARPNNALQAESALLFVQMIDRRHERPDEDNFDDIWLRFQALIKKSRGLGTFPFTQVTEALREVGEFVDSEVFDGLVEEIADELGRRRREGESAVINVERAHQKLKNDKPYEAIRWFGRSIDHLLKKEYEHELFSALTGLVVAYDKAGLPWAARSCAMAVVGHQFTENLKREGTVEGVSPALLNALFNFELQLGRVPQAVAFHNLEMSVLHGRARDDEAKAEVEVRRRNNAFLLGSLLLRTPLERLRDLERLPDLLLQLELFEAAFPTLFILGQFEVMRRDGWVPSDMSDGEIDAILLQLHKEGTSHNIAEQPVVNIGERGDYRASILGAELQFDTAPNMHSVSIAEGLLGVMESFVATSLDARVFPIVERLIIRVDPDQAHQGPPVLRFGEESGITVGSIVHAPDFSTSSREALSGFCRFCLQAVAEIVRRMITPADAEDFLGRLEAERVLDRALTFCHVPLMTENLFGSSEPLTMRAFHGADCATYPSLRAEEWPVPEDPSETGPQQYGEGEVPEDLCDVERRSHRDYQIRSPIDFAKWDAAQWNGSVFETGMPGDGFVPILGLSFENEAPAVAIFEGLRSRYGKADMNGELRIAIIRGISKDNPNAYAVSVGPSFECSPGERPGRIFSYVARLHRMYPQTSVNLDRFLAAYAEAGRALLAPFHRPSESATPRGVGDLIGLKQVVVREAWQIGEHDPDISALGEADEPLIPAGIVDAPVLKALARLKAFRARRS